MSLKTNILPSYIFLMLLFFCGFVSFIVFLKPHISKNMILMILHLLLHSMFLFLHQFFISLSSLFSLSPSIISNNKSSDTTSLAWRDQKVHMEWIWLAHRWVPSQVRSLDRRHFLNSSLTSKSLWTHRMLFVQHLQTPERQRVHFDLVYIDLQSTKKWQKMPEAY